MNKKQAAAIMFGLAGPEAMNMIDREVERLRGLPSKKDPDLHCCTVCREFGANMKQKFGQWRHVGCHAELTERLKTERTPKQVAFCLENGIE